MTYSTRERGGVLLYAVIAVTFLSGLSLYLQKMSDPKIFQTNDTQKILASEYLSDTIKILLENTVYNSQTFPKNESQIIDPSTNNVTAQFITKVTKAINDQKKIFLFSPADLLISSAEQLDELNDTDTSFEILNHTPLLIKSSSKVKYTLKTVNLSINKTIKLDIFIQQ